MAVNIRIMFKDLAKEDLDFTTDLEEAMWILNDWDLESLGIKEVKIQKAA